MVHANLLGIFIACDDIAMTPAIAASRPLSDWIADHTVSDSVTRRLSRRLIRLDQGFARPAVRM
jgi:hypothetical protein